MDDDATRPVAADVVVNQNDADPAPYAGMDVGRTLLGPRYALVDAAFAKAGRGRAIRPEPRRVLVTFGGTDQAGWTGATVAALQALGRALEVEVVSGPCTVTERTDLPSLAPSMAACDLLVTDAGSTVWQACCAALPMLAVATVGNQARVAATLARHEAALTVRGTDLAPESRVGTLTDLLLQATDPALRNRMSRNVAALADGQGATRIAHVLLQCAKEGT